MRGNMQSKAARQSEAARLVRSLSYEQRQDKSRHSSRGAACGCNQQAAHCSPAVPYYVRSTEAAASNDCYYIYRLGHYNKISKYLVIIQFESCHKSGCKRATVVCWHWRCKLPLLLLLGQHTRTTLPFIGYLPAIAATALPLTGPQSQKALRMCPTWCKKSPNIVAWAQHKTNIDMDTWIW